MNCEILRTFSSKIVQSVTIMSLLISKQFRYIFCNIYGKIMLKQTRPTDLLSTIMTGKAAEKQYSRFSTSDTG